MESATRRGAASRFAYRDSARVTLAYGKRARRRILEFDVERRYFQGDGGRSRNLGPILATTPGCARVQMGGTWNRADLESIHKLCTNSRVRPDVGRTDS